MNPRDKLIVALDVDSASRALEIFNELRDSVGMFKIGMQLFTAAGPEIVRQIVARGGKIFLDLKYHDIPNTVAMAGVEATRLGVSLFNIHAAGGYEMMRRAAEGIAETAEREELQRPRLLAVTLLTSIDQETLQQIGIAEQPPDVVTRLAKLARDAGLDGVVASPQEIETIRASVAQPGFLIVTPGIRAGGDQTDDQRRTMTVTEAIRAGADLIVVGRPILAAANPAQAAHAIVREIDEALRGRHTVEFPEQSRAQSVQ